MQSGNEENNTSLVILQKLLELGWNVLSHPHLFHSMQNSLKNKIFNDADDVKSPLIQFFASKNQKFYEHGIMILSENWHKVRIEFCLIFYGEFDKIM
ncbi:Ammar1 transposase [Vespula squamosa]|uniref:Ammar1 transposase n=1 Tax=Vespula squamosa TaxID=30214 RepID=A0ABD2BSI7_VESSQ